MGALSEKPTFQEIADMPFPASQNAMRKFYNAQWGLPIPEGVDRPLQYEVTVDYSFRESGSRTVTISAFSEDEARELAEDEIAISLGDCDDIEFDDAEVKLLEAVH